MQTQLMQRWLLLVANLGKGGILGLVDEGLAGDGVVRVVSVAAAGVGAAGERRVALAGGRREQRRHRLVLELNVCALAFRHHASVRYNETL